MNSNVTAFEKRVHPDDIMQLIFERDDGCVFLYFDARDTMEVNVCRASRLGSDGKKRMAKGLLVSGKLRQRCECDRLELFSRNQDQAA